MSSQCKIQSIYTDGACTGNPGPGGWGVVVYFTDGSIYEMGDAAAQTTNNRMEMAAAIAALKLLQSSGQTQAVTLHTDSEYLINAVTKWIKGWKKKGWKKADGNPVLNQDLLATLDLLNTNQVTWEHVRGHAGNIGNERCDEIARSYAKGKPTSLQQLDLASMVTELSESPTTSTLTYSYPPTVSVASDITIMEPSTPTTEELPREIRVVQLRNLVETLHIADEIAEKGYLIASSELADLMDVHASAVTSRGDQWRWRNWIVSRVRREGNQILWELERGDQVNSEAEEV
jgi:ribonuclease HI